MPEEVVNKAGMLAIWTDIAPEKEADFNQWYNNEHLAERSAIPGFLNGRRYRAISGEPRYLALYDTLDLQVLHSAEYHVRLGNPTPWTQNIIPHFRNVTRLACTVQMCLGAGCAGVVATLRFKPKIGHEAKLASWLQEQALPTVMQQPGVVGAYFLQSDDNEQSDGTTEGKLRANWEQTGAWVIIVDACSEANCRALYNGLLSATQMQQHGAESDVCSGMYQFLYLTFGS